MKSEPVSNQLLHEFMGYESSNEKIQIIYVEYILQQIIKKKKNVKLNFFKGNTSSDRRKYETVAKCFEMPRIEMTQHYNSIECFHYRYDLIKQIFVASLGLVLPVPCLKFFSTVLNCKFRIGIRL